MTTATKAATTELAATTWEARGLPKLAEDHDVSGAFLRLEVARGRLQATRLGRRVVVLRADWERYLKAGRGDAA